MKFLVDMPLVMSLAEWIWGEDNLVTPRQCVELFPLMISACWSRLVAKALGCGIILGAFLNKAPIIINLIDAESSEGLSRSSLYFDVMVYANGFAYGFLEGYPLTAYGENAALILQSIVIVLLAWKFTPSVTFTEKAVVGVIAFAYSVFVSNILPPNQYYLLMAAIWPAMIYARGSQIYATYQVKHTGAQSIITTTMNLAGSSIRILTTLKEVGWDVPALTGFGISVVLNSIAFVQHWLYWENTEKFVRQLEAKRNEEEAKLRQKAKERAEARKKASETAIWSKEKLKEKEKKKEE